MNSRLPRAGLLRALAPLALAAVLACGALAGCTSADAAPAADNALCAGIAHINGLVIQRHNALPQNHETFTFPARITVTGARPAQSVAHALCGLPAMPTGSFACPDDVGITYRMTFSASGRRLPPVTAAATGCQQVSGLRPVRWTEDSPSFWTTLAAAAHITPARPGTFDGSPPS